MTTATDDLLTKLTREVASTMGHLTLTSSPPGARITIDDEPIGITPLAWDLAVGPHTITMQRDHHTPQTRTVTVRLDRTDAIDMASPDPVVTAPAHGPSDRPHSLSHLVPLTAMAVGATAIIAGGIMIAIDREAAPLAPPMLHNSAPAGTALSITGAAIAGVGAYLWFRGPAVRSSPVAAVTGGTAYLGWSGRF